MVNPEEDSGFVSVKFLLKGVRFPRAVSTAEVKRAIKPRIIRDMLPKLAKFVCENGLIKDLPQDIPVTENIVRMTMKQKKYSTLWVMLNFLDTTTALVAVRVPKRSKNADFFTAIKGRPIQAIKLSEVEEIEYELLLNSTTAETFKSAGNLRETVGKTLAEMMEVENSNLFEGKRGDIKYDLMEATAKHYRIYAFGSRTVGLGFKTSDYDVYIDMENYYRGGGETNRANSIGRIREQMRRSKAFTDFILIPRARVPVLKVKHEGTQIHCDISVTNGLGVENSKLLRNYLSDHRVRFAAAAVKQWALQLGLTQAGQGPGAISSYCIVWLLLYSLMRTNPPTVSSVSKLRQMHRGPKLYVDGWDCSHCELSHPKSKNTKSEIELLHFFFNFYGNMTIKDLKQNVICPYMGSEIPVSDFVKTESLPNEFDNYKKQAAKHKFYQMSCNSFMVVQDPVEQNHNIAKSVEGWVMDRFCKLCKTTAVLMESGMTKELKYAKENHK